MLKQKTIQYLYLIASLFLIYSSYNYIIVKDYWQLFINFEFFIILIYMNFFYKKHPLKLSEASIYLILLHFSAYGIRAFLSQSMFQVILSLVIVSSLIIYIIYSKKKRYPIYFNYKVKWPFYFEHSVWKYYRYTLNYRYIK
jgi:hypothetical protein